MKRRPQGSPELTHWVTMNSLIVQWIFNTFDVSIINSVLYMADARDLWDHLKKRLFARNNPRTHELKEAIGNYKQNGASVFDYYGQLTRL